MSITAHLCGLTDFREVVVPPAAGIIREVVAAQVGYALVEPDLPIARLPVPRDVIDRAVLATIVWGVPRSLLFVPGSTPQLAKVKDERALSLMVSFCAPATGSPLFEAAIAVLAEHGAPMHGKELLREARSRRGGANTKDGAELARAIVRAWSDGLLALAVP